MFKNWVEFVKSGLKTAEQEWNKSDRQVRSWGVITDNDLKMYYLGERDCHAFWMGYFQSYVLVAEDTPPTGYDVYCSQDAPTFATWERVAWFNTERNAKRWVEEAPYRLYVTPLGEPIGFLEFRILPAGSPAPEGGDQ